MSPELHRKIRDANPRGFGNPAVERLLFANAERIMALDLAAGWRDEIAFLIAAPVGDLVTVTSELVQARKLEAPVPFPPPDGEVAIVFAHADHLDESPGCSARGCEVFRRDAIGEVEGTHGGPVIRSGARLRVIVETVTARERDATRVGGPTTFRTHAIGVWLPRIAFRCESCGRPLV
jgi:hypothetical protein